MDGANSEWNCDDKECEIWVKIMHNNSSLTQTHQDDMAYLAYIGESSSSLAEQIGEKLSAAGIKCHVFSDLSSLIENSQNILPDIVLLNPALNDDGEVAQALYRKAPTVVYAGDMDIDDQMVLYQQGVKRVIVDPGSELAGRVHAAANMVLYRRNEVRFARQQSLTHGTVTGTARGPTEARRSRRCARARSARRAVSGARCGRARRSRARSRPRSHRAPPRRSRRP